MLSLLGLANSAIKRMLSAGLIEESEERPVPELDDERRRYYGITDQGMRVLRHQAEWLQLLTDMARDKRVLGGRRPMSVSADPEPEHGMAARVYIRIAAAVLPRAFAKDPGETAGEASKRLYPDLSRAQRGENACDSGCSCSLRSRLRCC